MVEKTYTDEQGYLYTSTEAVWEDVNSDEEPEATKPAEKESPKKKAKKAVKPKAMKQGTLMGFFTKKK